MRFERGKNPKEALGIGGHRKDLQKGDYFFVRFRIRESNPKYYDFQKREREGKFAEAYANEIDKLGLDSRMKLVKCVVNGIPHEYFWAHWNEDEGCWVIE